MSGLRPGSRAHTLAQLAPGASVLFEVAPGRSVTVTMQSFGSDIRRSGIKASQEHLLAINPSTRAVVDIVRITRIQ